MTGAAILITIQSVCATLTELLKFLQTEQGKQYIAQIQANHQNIEEFFTKIGTPFKGLVDKIKSDVGATNGSN